MSWQYNEKWCTDVYHQGPDGQRLLATWLAKASQTATKKGIGRDEVHLLLLGIGMLTRDLEGRFMRQALPPQGMPDHVLNTKLVREVIDDVLNTYCKKLRVGWQAHCGAPEEHQSTPPTEGGSVSSGVAARVKRRRGKQLVEEHGDEENPPPQKRAKTGAGSKDRGKPAATSKVPAISEEEEVQPLPKKRGKTAATAGSTAKKAASSAAPAPQLPAKQTSQKQKERTRRTTSTTHIRAAKEGAKK